MNVDLQEKVHQLDKAVFGDRENPAMPGLISDRDRITFEQKRTNEILTELRDSVRWLTRTVVAAIVTGLVGFGGLVVQMVLRRPPF